MKLLRLLANLGYGSRKEVTAMLREGRVTDRAGEVVRANGRIWPRVAPTAERLRCARDQKKVLLWQPVL